MRKIPTLFTRDFTPPSDGRYVTQIVAPDCSWVMQGYGHPTRKYDGTCVMVDDDQCWWFRREVKAGKAAPLGFQEISTDRETGKTVGWEPHYRSGYQHVLTDTLVVAAMAGLTTWKPGTYELCGPKVNGNPEGFKHHQLVPHGQTLLGLTVQDRTFEGIRAWLMDHRHVEGIVFWRELGNPNAGMAKIKGRDFHYDHVR